MSSISSFDIISNVDPDPTMFLCIPVSVADAAVNPNGIKMLLDNGLITFSINCKTVFSNGPRSLPRNPPNCTILDSWVFDSLILTDELFATALQRFASCVLVNNNLCGKLVSSSELPIILGDNLETTSVSFL